MNRFKSLSFILITFFSAGSSAAVMEPTPPLLVSCQVQAFIMPTGKANAFNEVIITTELLEKGVRLNRILPHNRVVEGSFYAFGEMTRTFFVNSARFDMKKHKENVMIEARKAFLVSFNFHTLEESIRVMGCSTTQLQ